MAKSGLSLNAIAGPSRGFVMGVPRAYQGGYTLILLYFILVVFKCLNRVLLFITWRLAFSCWPLSAWTTPAGQTLHSCGFYNSPADGKSAGEQKHPVGEQCHPKACPLALGEGRGFFGYEM
jgi:hypothetical protein